MKVGRGNRCFSFGAAKAVFSAVSAYLIVRLLFSGI